MNLVLVQQPGAIRGLRDYFIYLTGRKRWPDLHKDFLLGKTLARERDGRYYLDAVRCEELQPAETFAELLANEAGREEAARRLHAKALNMALDFRMRHMVDGSGDVPEVKDMTLFGNCP